MPLHLILFNFLLALLPTQLGYHWWPSWALVLGRRIDYLSPTLYLTDILIIFLLVSWCIAWRDKLFSKRNIRRSTVIKIIFLVGFIIANIYFAGNRWVAVFSWIKILELAALGIYIIQTKPKFSSIIIPLSIGVFYSSAIAIIQFLLQHSIGGLLWFLGERTFTAMTPGIAQTPLCFPNQFNCPLLLRSYATFSHPNVLGGFLAIILLGIIQYSNNPIIKLSNTKKIFFITTTLLGILALILTFSRSAWIIAVLSILYLVLQKKKKMFFPVILFVLIFIFFIVTTFGLQDESVVVREQLNTAAIHMFISSLIIGNGLGNFLVQLPDYLVSRQIYFLQPVHNIFLLLLAQTGIIGFVLFFWLLWKAMSNHSLLIYRLILGMILLLGLVDHYFVTLQQGQLLLTLFLALSLVPKTSLNQ